MTIHAQRTEAVTDELVAVRGADKPRVLIHSSCHRINERWHLNAYKATDGRWYVVKGRERHYLTECVITSFDGKDLLFAFKTSHPK